MTDREKVVRGLECIGGYRHMEANPCAECGYNECQTFSICLGEVARDALELLKEQDPVKPIRLENWWKCPSCSGNIVANMNYCPRCGKAVKWK